MKKVLFVAALAGSAMLAACGENPSGVRMGSLSSDFDSLSYALGANIGTGVGRDMRDIPFDYKVMEQAIKEGAMGKAKQDHDESVDMLRNYFTQIRPERMQAIAKERAEQDSIRLASGDTTKVEYPVADEAMFESEEQRKKISYAFGNDIGYNLANNEAGLPLQVVWICQAIQDVHEGKAQMDEMAVMEYLQNYFMVTLPQQNKEASEAWLAKIEKKSGVRKTESGLLYKVVEAGDENVMAKDSRDQVKVHYTGRTRKGKVFDASRFADRDKQQQEMLRKNRPDMFNEDGSLKEAEEPVEFPLNRVIPGWTEGMKLVGKGGKIILWIPSDLAYGPRGAGGAIGANEALEFEVELIDVIPFEEPVQEAETEEAAEKTAEETK